MTTTTEKRWLLLIITLFIGLGFTYALVTPVFEASDELWHYPMIRHLADGNPLPVQVFDPAEAGPWKQEASQPPLYYYLGAALTFWIDTSDMEMVRWQNPHVDNGILTADGNKNLVIHNPAWDPWQGTLLAVRLVRFVSVFLGAATVTLTYLIAKEVTPNRPEIALGAAALNAFMPMFLFISGAVNNDNLAIPLASLAVYLMITAVTRRKTIYDLRFTIYEPRWFLLGVIIGLALLTKEGAFALLPLAFGAIFIRRWQVAGSKWQVTGDEWRPFLARLLRLLGQSLLIFAVVLAPVVLIAGWWYWRNVVLYGDFLGWNAFIAVLGQRAHPASLAQLWSERWGFLLSYWGLFGGVNVPMWEWIYHVLNGVLIVGVLGFVIYLVQEIGDWRSEISPVHLNSTAESAKDAEIKDEKNPLRSLRPLRLMKIAIIYLLDFVERKYALIVCFLFAAAVVVGLVRWATTTWSSQGRLVFTAVSALNVLLAVGLAGWLSPRRARRVLGGVAGFLLVAAALAPFAWIRPTYQPNQYSGHWLLPQPTNVNFGGKLRLVSYELGKTAVQPQRSIQPGDTIDLMLGWEALEPMANDWSVFVHLNDPVLGAPIAQRDMYLDQGLRPTTLLQAGDKIFNYYQLRIPETAVAPADLQLTVGLYDFYTEERLLISPTQDTAVLARLPLESAPGAYPNPVAVNFENALELVGFELEPRQTAPGEAVDLMLYWRAQRPLTTDYTIFVQVVGKDTTLWANENLGQSTSEWPVDAVQAIPVTLTLNPDTPPKVYPVILGVYSVTEMGEFDRLQVIAPDGRPTDDFLELTLLRVNEP